MKVSVKGTSWSHIGTKQKCVSSPDYSAFIVSDCHAVHMHSTLFKWSQCRSFVSSQSPQHTLPRSVQLHSQWEKVLDQKRAVDERHRPVNHLHTFHVHSSPMRAEYSLKKRRMVMGQIVKLTGNKLGKCRLKIPIWRKRMTKKWTAHTRTHAGFSVPCTDTWPAIQTPCSSQLVSLLVGVVRSASQRRHVPWQHSYLIGSIAMATEASLLSQG